MRTSVVSASEHLMKTSEPVVTGSSVLAHGGSMRTV